MRVDRQVDARRLEAGRRAAVTGVERGGARDVNLRARYVDVERRDAELQIQRQVHADVEHVVAAIARRNAQVDIAHTRERRQTVSDHHVQIRVDAE